MNKVKFYHVV
ncbi:UNVERIFIED_CONTAM: hypothetical protein GTU68_044947 [Idotea baltica]|nr:hypothetical protein [Idotea baltica]